MIDVTYPIIQALPLSIGLIVTLMIGSYAWQRRSTPGASYFAVYMFAAALWNTSILLMIVLTEPSFQIATRYLASVSCIVMPIAWHMFALRYTGRATHISKWKWARVLFIPTLLLIVLGVLYVDVERQLAAGEDLATAAQKLEEILTFDGGDEDEETETPPTPNETEAQVTIKTDPTTTPGEGLITLIGVLNLLAMIWQLIRGMRLIIQERQRVAGLQRGHFILLLIGVLTPWPFGLARFWSATAFPPLGLLPTVFLLSNLLMIWKFPQHAVFETLPIVQGTIVNGILDGVILLDAQHCIMDVNPAGLQMVRRDLDTLKKQALAEALPDWPPVHAYLAEVCAQPSPPDLNTEAPGREITLVHDDARSHYDLRITPLYNQTVISGWVILLRDITAQKEAEEALRRYTADLEASNAELDAFAHTVAHDRKTPLTALLGFSMLLERRARRWPADKIETNAQRITQTGHKMTSIINELLLLASVRKMDEVEVSPLDMGTVVNEVQTRLEDMVTEYQGDLVLPERWPSALGYAPWVEEVWVNYVSNALKYGGTPPRVELGAEQPNGDGQVRFWCRDNGRGLTPEEQATLFAEFTRLEQTRVEGHGLGLSIVRRIAEKLQGHVGVESAVGEGSIFWFTLPNDTCSDGHFPGS